MTASMIVAGIICVPLLGWAIFRVQDWLCAAGRHELVHSRLLTVSKGGRFCLVRRSCRCGRVRRLIRVVAP